MKVLTTTADSEYDYVELRKRAALSRPILFSMYCEAMPRRGTRSIHNRRSGGRATQAYVEGVI